MSELGAAIVGLGYWGPNLLRNFAASERWSVRWVVDPDETRRRKAERLYPTAQSAADFEASLNDPNVDLVVLATPPALHHSMAQQAISAGKHVLVEKPLAEDAGDARAMMKAAAQAGVLLFTDHTFLYAGAVEAMRKRLLSGELGDVYYAESSRVNLGLFQQTNVIWDLAPHDISILNYVFDELPEAVACHTMAYIHPPVADVAFLLLRYASGRMAQIHLSWLSPVKVRRMMLSASSRMLVWDDVDPSEKVRIYDKGVVREPTSETLPRQMVSYRMGDVLIPILDGREPLAKLAEDVRASIVDAKPSRIGGNVGYDVVRCIEAACRSAHLNGQWVPLER